MRVLYFLILFFGLMANGQTLSIPDANFKAKLLAANTTNTIAKNIAGNYFKIDANDDGEIQLSEAVNVRELYVSNSSISSLSGIESFIGLRLLKCEHNSLTALPVQNLPTLHFLYCGYNQLAQLTIPKTLLGLFCYHNSISSIDLTGMTSLIYLQIHHNQLVTIDISMLSSGNGLDVNCSYNNLVTMFVKNGGFSSFDFDHNPTLQYICVDEVELVAFKGACQANGNTLCEVNSYCSFGPGGKSFTLQGTNKFDSDNNGCDNTDMQFPALRFSIASGSSTGTLFSNETGNYKLLVPQGNHTVTPILENASYFSISPAVLNVSFPPQQSPYNSNFCISKNGAHPDVYVQIIPVTPAIPGFDAKYKVIYSNVGTETVSGAINFNFNDDVIDYLSSQPVTSSSSIGLLTWNFSNLEPFQKQVIYITFSLNSPVEIPALNSGDILNYSVAITTDLTDETPQNNTAILNQTVLNSFDPNDKTCLEGNTITPEMIGKYVHYIIRFENTGTANAHNIVVKDVIDTSKFDISSLVPLNASHSFTTRIKDSNNVEFIFENINLPFDDANNDGYVLFKIKTKPTLAIGDSFSNTASIYFDYNFPIITDPAITTIEILGTKDFSFENYFFLHPNPVSDSLNFSSKQKIQIYSVSIFNILGQLVMVMPNAADRKSIDVSELASGNYIIKINTDKGISSARFIKK